MGNPGVQGDINSPQQGNPTPPGLGWGQSPSGSDSGQLPTGSARGGGVVSGIGGPAGSGPGGMPGWGGSVPFNTGQIGGMIGFTPAYPGGDPGNIPGANSWQSMGAAGANAITQGNQSLQRQQQDLTSNYMAQQASINIQMQQQALQQQQLRTQTFARLLNVFGSGGGGAVNPAQGFMNTLMAGGQGLTDLANNSPTLPGRLGQVDIAFNDPGSLRSRMQQLGTAENRFSGDSIVGAQRQAALDRDLGIARSNALGGAFTDVINPMLNAAQTTTQGWLSGQATPQFIANTLARMAGPVG